MLTQRPITHYPFLLQHVAERKMDPATPVVCPQSPQQWRAWLQAHHLDQQAVWLVYYKKNAA